MYFISSLWRQAIAWITDDTGHWCICVCVNMFWWVNPFKPVFWWIFFKLVDKQDHGSSASLMMCKTDLVTHLTLDKIAAISQTTFSDAFSWMRSFVFGFDSHWRLSLRVQLAIHQHWFRYCICTEHATSHYLNQCRPSLLTHIYIYIYNGTKGRKVNSWKPSETYMRQ